MKNNKNISIISIVSVIFSILTIIELFITNYLFTHRCNPCAGGSCCGMSTKEQGIYDILSKYTTIYNLISICFLIMIPIIIYKCIKKTLSKSTIIIFIITIIIYAVTTITIIIKEFNRDYQYLEKIDKPIIYIYPTDKTKLTITLNNDEKILYSYPKYDKSWEIIVDKDSNIYDLKTKRNYYALFWEGKDNTIINENEGFVVPGKETRTFLEEKLEFLGLNEKELNEFIIYWLPKLEKNKYTYIRFRTKEEIKSYNKINVNHKIDTLIQVYMDFKPLNKKINVIEQKLEKNERSGFTIVEWGGRELK